MLFIVSMYFQYYLFFCLAKVVKFMKKMVNDIMQLVPGWSPQRMMMDFEKAAMNMIIGRFPTIELSGCFFHLSQNVLRFLQVSLF